ncbi:g1257 [Coccomyxa elongata]
MIAESSNSRTASFTSDQAAPLAGHAFTTSVTKEDLGRATWLLLHTIAAQYPANPSKQQRKDVAALVDTLTRIYPCGECAFHFQEIVRRNAPATGNAQELQQWMCNVHNNVNRSLGKAEFNCELVDARWSGLDCGDDMACDITSRMGRGFRR